jgi:hypothetical protein
MNVHPEEPLDRLRDHLIRRGLGGADGGGLRIEGGLLFVDRGRGVPITVQPQADGRFEIDVTTQIRIRLAGPGPLDTNAARAMAREHTRQSFEALFASLGLECDDAADWESDATTDIARWTRGGMTTDEVGDLLCALSGRAIEVTWTVSD